jgi:hypothetical protein
MNAYAPGGGYAFCAGLLGSMGDKELDKRNAWIKGRVRKE